MIKIGICFPTQDFIRHEEEIDKYFKLFKEKNLYSLDMYTEFILKHKPTNHLLKQLNHNNLKLTFHYNGKIDKDSNKAIKQIKKELKEIRKILDKNHHLYQTNIVFHIPDYQDNKYQHIKKMIVLFKQISEYALKLRFNILIETLSNNHPKGNHVGNDFSEIILFLNNITNKNFGVCWDIGHTRLNNIEDHENLFIPKKMIDRIMFTHIHNAYQKNGEFNEHIPLTDLKLQDDELEFLIKNDYKGIYNLEYGLECIKENIEIYLNNIEKLNNFIKKKKEKENGI